jgi:hypothetical protein
MKTSALHRSLVRGSSLAIIVAAACTEPRTPQRVSTPTPALEARLEISDSLPHVGSEITIGVHLHGAAADHIASFTERLSYDSTGLRYVGDVAISDGATRVSNPTPGLIRSAGMRADGFAGGVLVEYKFLVLNPSAVRRMQLSVDELHELSHADAAKSVRIAAEPTMRVP